jgi:predicted AAA+ superfamily ATPase
VLDEIQRAPELFSYIQGIVDERRKPGLFIVTGSQQFGLLAQVSQTLAGRVATLELLPFSLNELTSAGLSIPSLDQLLFQGQYPPLYDRDVDPVDWYADYIRTYVERDVRQISAVQDLNLFQTLVRLVWRMMQGWHTTRRARGYPSWKRATLSTVLTRTTEISPSV